VLQDRYMANSLLVEIWVVQIFRDEGFPVPQLSELLDAVGTILVLPDVLEVIDQGGLRLLAIKMDAGDTYLAIIGDA